MVTHVVLFKLRDASAASVEATAAVIRAMAGRVPVLRELQVGVDVVRSDRSYDLALIARFDDWDGLDLYRKDATHGRVIAHLQSVVTASVVVDYAD